MKMLTFRGSLPFILALALLAGCAREEAGQPPGESAPEAVLAPDDGEDFELSWQGVLPCADCEGIETRLSLRRDQGGERFELQETYLGAEGDNVFATTGEWRPESPEGEGATVYRLGPEAGGLGFELQPDGSLQLLGADGQPPEGALAFRLHRL